MTQEGQFASRWPHVLPNLHLAVLAGWDKKDVILENKPEKSLKIKNGAEKQTGKRARPCESGKRSGPHPASNRGWPALIHSLPKISSSGMSWFPQGYTANLRGGG
ncbi:MAG TPA: hypothetical protein VFZ27_15365 [Terriglobia bacterium]|nr:hypothetical protein [Terriglobia bacterium]